MAEPQPGRLIHQRLREDGSWEETEGWAEYVGPGTIRLHVGPLPEPSARCLVGNCSFRAEREGLCQSCYDEAYPEKMDAIHHHMAYEHERHQAALDAGTYQWMVQRRQRVSLFSEGTDE